MQRDIPAEADLIRRCREAAAPPMSRRQAAAKAGLSPSQWGDVERGSKKAGTGIVVPVQATASTLARMASTVGASADDLAAAGRDDAAHLLRRHDHDRDLRKQISAVPGLGGVLGTRQIATDEQELLPLITAGLDAIDRSNLASSAKRQLTAMFVSGLIHDATRRHSELVLMLSLAAPGHKTDTSGR